MKTLAHALLTLTLSACVAVESESPDLQVLGGAHADVHAPSVARDGGDELAWRLLEARGTAALLGGRFDEAQAAFASVPVERLSPTVWPVAARVALLVDAPRAARRLLHRHLREHPDDAAARLDMARALLLLDDPGACRAQLSLLPPARAAAPAARELRGLALLADGAVSDALVELRAVLALGGDDANLRRLVAQTEARLRAALRAASADDAPADAVPPDEAP